MLRRLKKSRSKYLILSLLFHLVTFVSLVVLRDPIPPAPEIIEVSFEPPPPQDIATEVKSVKQKARREMPQQIVEQTEKRINDDKSDTRFLSRFDQTVIKQTRAQETGAFTNTAEIAQSQAGQRDGEKKKSKAKADPHDKGDLPKLADLKPQFSETPQSMHETAKNPGTPSQTDDYIKDVEVGIQTLLTTKEFIYYSYYQRIKDQLRQHWEPTVREKVKIMYRKGRNLASAADHVTQVLITLDQRGFLERVDILGQSGVQDLDDAAIEAFKKSAPFPNPPKGIVERDGRIRIRWDFVLEA